MLKVKIKKLSENAVVPSYSKSGDAGMDLTAVSKTYDEEGNVCYSTGLAFEIPSGYVGLLFPRSSNAKKDLILSNSVGILDSGYRGEVMFKFKPGIRVCHLNTKQHHESHIPHLIHYSAKGENYQIGDRIGQIIVIPYPEIEFEEVEELSKTERGEGGYGSTGI